MRINKFIAQSSNLSRRAADKVINNGRITINGQAATTGQDVNPKDEILFDGKRLVLEMYKTIMFHKPVGYVVSRNGQGNPTIFDLLPKQFQRLQPVGRLDKDSSGLLILTNDGQLAQRLSHPSFSKTKEYDIALNKTLKPSDKLLISRGVKLSDGLSHLTISGNDRKWQIVMAEGRNRQIRRTFEKIGYQVMDLHRISFGPYKLGALPVGKWQIIENTDII
jgi:23S rRNA pseudouridine2605 synthase